MKREEVQAAFRFFVDEVEAAASPFGVQEVYPHMSLAMQACAKKLDAMDKEDRDRLKAIAFFKEEIDRLDRAPAINGCAMTPEWAENKRFCEIAITLLEEERK